MRIYNIVAVGLNISFCLVPKRSYIISMIPVVASSEREAEVLFSRPRGRAEKAV